jgi:hypothetical protein
MTLAESFRLEGRFLQESRVVMVGSKRGFRFKR